MKDIPENWVVTKPRQIMEGMTASPTSRGVTVIELHYNADPIGLTPDILDAERRLQGCVQRPDGTWKTSWKWQKEMELDWEAQAGKPVFDPQWLESLRPALRPPAYRMDTDLTVAEMSAGMFAAETPEGFAVPEGRSHESPEPLWRMEEDLVAIGPAFWPLEDAVKRCLLATTLVRKAKGRVAVWIGPDDQPEELPDGVESVTRAFGTGIDVGEGVDASDSTIQVFAAHRREQAAEFASNTIRPADLGRMAVAVARYFNNSLVCCVRKMHGLTVIRTMRDDCRYSMIWSKTTPGTMVEIPTPQLGWGGGESSDELLFGRWMDAIEHRETILHSLTCWQQHRQYIYDTSGRITHQALVEMPVEVRERHGDLVVGSALAFRACMDLPRFRKVVPVDTAPHGSLNWRKKQRKQKGKVAPDGLAW